MPGVCFVVQTGIGSISSLALSQRTIFGSIPISSITFELIGIDPRIVRWLSASEEIDPIADCTSMRGEWAPPTASYCLLLP